MGGRLKLKLELPEPIIQHIQSFLTGKEAARTTILSKSWHSAWYTLPYLDLDERVFIASGYSFSEFSKYVKNTIDWYEQSNLKIESLKLSMSSADLAKGLIVKALGKLGATRLSFQFNDLLSGRIVLPHELLFGADNLVELSVQGYCEIKLDGMEKKFRRLESLCLDEVRTTSDALSNLIFCCPLIENLSLSRIIYDNENDYDYGYLSCCMKVWPTLVGPRLVPLRPPVCLTNTNLDRLRCLVLSYKSFEFFFPGDLLSKFPSLTDLTLHVKVSLGRIAEVGEVQISNQEEDLHISNRSLERVKLEFSWYNDYDDDDVDNVSVPNWRGPTVKLDVPRIRNFTFEGVSIIPSLSFVSSSTREWESHVSITRKGGFTTFWFGVMNEFLAKLRLSKIYLSLQVNCRRSFDYKLGDVSVIRKHELENLTIDTTGLPTCYCYSLFDGLFRLCRPKLITQTQKKGYCYPQFPFGHPFHTPDPNKIIFDILCKVLDQGIHFKGSDPSLFVYGSLNDLEEVNAQIFDVGLMVWRPPIPLKSLLLLEDRDQQQRVRLLLKWNT